MLTRCSNVSRVRELLDEFPVLVQGLYDSIILDVDLQNTEPKIVQHVLAWLVCALRPIRLCEVIEALMIDLDWRTMVPDRLSEVIKVPVSTKTLESRALEGEIGSALLHILGSLVTYDDKTDSIALLHSSLKVSYASLCA